MSLVGLRDAGTRPGGPPQSTPHKPAAVAEHPAPIAAGGAKVLALERRLAHWILRAIGSPPVALVLWNGEAIVESTARPTARILLHDCATFWRVLLDPTSSSATPTATAGWRSKAIWWCCWKPLAVRGRRPAAQAVSFPPRCSAGCTTPGPIRFPRPGEHPSPLRHWRRLLPPLARP